MSNYLKIYLYILEKNYYLEFIDNIISQFLEKFNHNI